MYVCACVYPFLEQGVLSRQFMESILSFHGVDPRPRIELRLSDLHKQASLSTEPSHQPNGNYYFFSLLIHLFV